MMTCFNELHAKHEYTCLRPTQRHVYLYIKCIDRILHYFKILNIFPIVWARKIFNVTYVDHILYI